MKEVKLSKILQVMDECGLISRSYVWGTIMDYVGLPSFRSLYNKEFGLIATSLKHGVWYAHYEHIFAKVFSLAKIRYREITIEGDLTPWLAISSPIVVDIPRELITKNGGLTPIGKIEILGF